MYKFAICDYDMDAYDPELIIYITFDEYKYAKKYYLNKLMQSDSYGFDKTLWIALIETDRNCIVQFEQLTTKTITKLVPIRRDNYETTD